MDSNTLTLIIIIAVFVCLSGLGVFFTRRALGQFDKRGKAGFKPLLSVQKRYDKIRQVTRIPCGVLYITAAEQEADLAANLGDGGFSRLENAVLSSFNGQEDMVSKIRKGEFLVLTRMSESRLTAALSQIRRDMLLFSKLNPSEKHLELYFGAYLIPAGNIDFEQTVSRAKLACLEAKKSGRKYVAWDYNLQNDYDNRAEVEKSLRRGVKNNNFFLEFQPIIDIQSGNIVGGEVLTRLNGNSGVLLPADFISAVKDKNMEAEFDQYVFGKTCRWIASHREVCKYLKYISVNFTRATLSIDGMADKILEKLDECGIERGFVAVELVENGGEAGIVVDGIKQNLSALKAAGMPIMLDDFGDGYSSFEDLKNYPVDAIKISRSVTENIQTAIGLRIFKSMINVAKDMDALIVCEGAETPAQIKAIRDCGVVYVQGYYFYRSVSPDQFEKAIIKNRTKQGESEL